MAIILTTTLNKISFIPNSTNSTIIRDFYEYMKANGTSENYQNQNLKAMIVFANFLFVPNDKSLSSSIRSSNISQLRKYSS
jgi:hypothetical protein